MKHKYAEMIKAKVENMNLVLLARVNNKWSASLLEFPMGNAADYFLCHPKHKDTCLHWLNGGAVKCQNVYYEDLSFVCAEIKPWDESCWYMNEAIESSIKPKKETRWIFIDTQFGFESSWCSNAYPTRELAMERMKDWTEKGADVNRMQIIEIEIEVE